MTVDKPTLRKSFGADSIFVDAHPRVGVAVGVMCNGTQVDGCFDLAAFFNFKPARI